LKVKAAFAKNENVTAVANARRLAAAWFREHIDANSENKPVNSGVEHAYVKYFENSLSI
jgi:hypothetical protein